MPFTTNLKGEQGGVTLGNTTTEYTSTVQKEYLQGFTVIVDATLDRLSINYADGDTDLVGVTLLAGSFIPGTIDDISVSGGLIMGHFGPRQ